MFSCIPAINKLFDNTNNLELYWAMERYKVTGSKMLMLFFILLQFNILGPFMISLRLEVNMQMHFH